MTFSATIDSIMSENEVLQVCGWTSAVISTISVIFGLISWIYLPKWRQIRHYVLINTLLNYSLHLAIREWLLPLLKPSICEFISRYVMFSHTHWLMIATVVFHVDFVKVLKYGEHAYLKANALGWLLPVLWAALGQGFDFLSYGNAARYFTFAIGCTVPLVNCIMYYKVIKSLCVSKETCICRKLKSTCVFLLNGVSTSTLAAMFLVNILLTSKPPESRYWFARVNYITQYTVVLSSFFTCLSINVFFLMLKSHRTLWAEPKPKAPFRHVRDSHASLTMRSINLSNPAM